VKIPIVLKEAALLEHLFRLMTDLFTRAFMIVKEDKSTTSLFFFACLEGEYLLYAFKET
jgi:hypothetical protein